MTIRRFFIRLRQSVVFVLLGIFIFLGSWCLPPNMVKRVIEELKAKYSTEFVHEKLDKKNKV